MKKMYTLILFLIAGLSIYANPIPLPTVEISELYFDESNNWKLELRYKYGDEEDIDSIFLYSNTDSSKMPSYKFIGSTGLFVITADSLDSDFHIEQTADTIQVISYSMDRPYEDILIFGNISGASINSPRQGQSISHYKNSYVKDQTPTIGEPNDTAGMCGTVKGIIYDKYSEPVGNRTFRLEDYFFETSENGEYSARVYSKPSTFRRIDYKTGQDSYQSVPIKEISYVMEPDSVVIRDIHLLDTLTTGINDINTANTPINVYPNPISKNEKLNINIDLPMITSDICLKMIDLNGEMLKKKKIHQSSSSIIAPGKSGFYIVRIMLDSEIISSKKIFVSE